ncbi:AAA-like domain protein [Phaeobacter inhibens]|uniref:ATP-binding protein n=1 Tax=Phaeobacter inhibens TaxID=221822 RepID=UPI000C9C4286|nr:ATP-binding protein [Phaeobacter inhibens]AUQ50006.1 AAA-like domain protein [Phaeobacter inhibens]AUQ54266.1 AAA-like domain protein [Phaeobacter inhibens]AUQ78282.1 AAA-like domain protein [Phaeobacter inhibens]AUR15441.1 AAA-like domain protein [Phaeobacter inhibens]AUR19811.1 AAA-like domain protein [Phaeobacter inhibens]
MSAKSNAGRIGVWGASGSGKSSYVKKAIKGRKRMVVFDPLAEYGTLCNVTVNTLDDVRKAMRADWSGFRIAYVPPAGREPLALSGLSKLLMLAQGPYKKTGKGQGVTLVVEEMNLSFPVHGGAEKAPGFAEICSRGRHFGIEVFGLSQRIAEVSTRFRGNCTETVVLRQQGPRDLKAAEDAIGAARGVVSGLKNLEYLHERAGTIKKGSIKH